MSKWMLMAVSVAAMGSTGCGNRPERFEKMVQWRIDDALDELDATQVQRDRVQALTKESIANAKPRCQSTIATAVAIASRIANTARHGSGKSLRSKSPPKTRLLTTPRLTT